MTCPNKNRHRARTVAFRLTDEEFLRLDQRVKVTGEVKGDYLRAMALEGEINIRVGKYKSDKLALAVKILSEELKKAMINQEEEIIGIVRESQILIEELNMLVTSESQTMEL